MSRRQRGEHVGKGKKRQRQWHRGDVEDIRWQEALKELPQTDSVADLELGIPLPLRRVANNNRGDAA